MRNIDKNKKLLEGEQIVFPKILNTVLKKLNIRCFNVGNRLSLKEYKNMTI